MIIFIVLSALFSLGIYFEKKSYHFGDFLGIIICILSGLYLILHVLFWSLASYDYNIFITKRDAFEQTLNEARKNGNQVELAAITKDVSEWNKDLAVKKYNITVFLLKDYTDKRVNDLQPIK